MEIPQEYVMWREDIGFTELSFGVSGIRLLPLAEINDGQVGYSRSEKGRSLCDGTNGSWKPEWIVIGYDTALGDPIILDTSSPTLQIMTAMHGDGIWDPHPIAKSLKAFAVALRAIKEITVGREDPIALENNPLNADELRHILQVIRDANGKGIDADFWKAMLQVKSAV